MESILKLVFFDRGFMLPYFVLTLMILSKAAVLKDFDKKKIRLAALQTESTGFSFVFYPCFIFLLPRQFHTAIVENNKETHIRTAIWFRCTCYFSTFCIPNCLAVIFF
jgi:Na+/proline symporter